MRDARGMIRETWFVRTGDRGSCSRPPSAAGFTLIELLVVISIITMLAGLLVGGVILAKQSANKRIAEAFIQAIDSAVELYESTFGDYPPGAGDVDSAESLYICLTTEKKGHNPFPFKESQLVDTDGDGKREVCDHWRQPLSYAHWREYADVEDAPRAHRFQISSAGANGEHEGGEGDDLTNWK